MEIRVKPIEANNWSGIQRYPNCNEALRPYYTRSGSIYTGLQRDDEKKLGDILGYDLRKGSSFWDTFKVIIGTESVVLNTDIPEDELKYLFLKGHKRVKPSLTSNKAGANYYLHNPEEEADTFNEVNRVKRKAIKEFDKLKPIEIKKALRLYGYKADNISDSVAEDRLYALVEQNPQHFFDKWVDNKNRATEFLIKEAIAKNVIRKQKNIHYFGTITLGKTQEEAVAYLDNSENADIKASIINDSNIK